VLASDPSEQIRWLRKDGVSDQWLQNAGFPGVADELALSFNDIAAARENMLQCGELSNKECEAIERLDKYLDQMSGSENAELWTVHALNTSKEWEEVRALAKLALSIF
jgi:hypothetical protein